MSCLSCKKRALEILESGIFSDISILVGESKFKCHKYALARVSDFFKNMFLQKDFESKEYRMEGTTPEVVEVILNFVYTENNKPIEILDYSILLKILKCSNMWQICELENICTDILKKELVNMESKSLIEYYEIFYQLENNIFLAEIIKILQTRWADSMDIEKLFDLEFNCFKKFIQSTLHIFPERERFEMVEKWIISHCLPDKLFDEYMNATLLDAIDFTKMSLNEFRNGPGKSKILTDITKYNIISQIALNMKSPEYDGVLDNQNLLFKIRQLAFFWIHSMCHWHENDICIVGRNDFVTWLRSDTFTISEEELKTKFNQTPRMLVNSHLFTTNIGHELMYFICTPKTFIFGGNSPNIKKALDLLAGEIKNLGC